MQNVVGRSSVPTGISGDILERSSCPICESATSELIMREPFDGPGISEFLKQHYEGRARIEPLIGYHYELVRCSQCRLVYQRTIPGDRLLAEIYDEWIPVSERERLHQGRTLNDYGYMAEQVYFIVDHLRMRPHEVDILDFGMGWAEWSNMARAFGCRVVGAELSIERLDYARSIGIETIDWDSIPKRKFHFINTEQVFEHLLKPLEVLQHLASALSPNGLILISVPNARPTLRHLQGRRDFASLSPSAVVPVQPLEHVNCFEYSTIVRLAERAGLLPLRPSVRRLYNSSLGWLNPKRAIRLLARPIYRHVFPKSTYVFLGHA